LNIRWMATKFVPRLLTDEEKQWRVWAPGNDGWSQERPTLSLEGCNRRRHLGLVLRHVNLTPVLSITKARHLHVRRERAISGRTWRVSSWSFSNSEDTLRKEFVPPDQMVNQHYYRKMSQRLWECGRSAVSEQCALRNNAARSHKVPCCHFRVRWNSCRFAGNYVCQNKVLTTL
jgi:hypothetical protein